MARLTLTFRHARSLQFPGLSHCENPHDRAGAVLRAPGHAVQRIPPHPRPARAGPHRRSRHVSVRQGRLAAGAARLPLPASAVRPRRRGSVRRSPRCRSIAALAADGDPARAGASATMPSTRTRRAASSGSLLAGVLGVPHLYDMHSSLPQQLTNFAFSRSRLLKRAFSLDGALRHPALAGRRS